MYRDSANYQMVQYPASDQSFLIKYQQLFQYKLIIFRYYQNYFIQKIIIIKTKAASLGNGLTKQSLIKKN
jgi:hypothetical protein